MFKSTTLSVVTLSLFITLRPIYNVIKADYRVFVIESHDYYKDYLLFLLFLTH